MHEIEDGEIGWPCSTHSEPPGRLNHACKDNIKMVVDETGYKGVEWI